MKIHTDKTELTERDIADILFDHENNFLPRVLKLKDYYVGRQDILQKPGRNNNAPNNKIVANFCEYITNMHTGFFMGQPVAYASVAGDDTSLKALQEVFRYNDESAHNLRLAEEASITGDAYEILYTDKDAEIRFSLVPSEQVIIVCDSTLEENMLYAIRRYRVFDLGRATYRDYVDVYDKSYVAVYAYDHGSLSLIRSAAPHYFDEVPVVEYPNNEQHRGDLRA